jgi:hypothetical protein
MNVDLPPKRRTRYNFVIFATSATDTIEGKRADRAPARERQTSALG